MLHDSTSSLLLLGLHTAEFHLDFYQPKVKFHFHTCIYTYIFTYKHAYLHKNIDNKAFEFHNATEEGFSARTANTH